MGTLDACYETKDPFNCSRIQGVWDPNLTSPAGPGGFSDITRIEPAAFNSEGYETKSYDVSIDWNQSFDFGTLSSRLIATRTIELLFIQEGGIIQDRSGVNGDTDGFLPDIRSVPDWTAQWINTYFNGPYSVTAMVRWVSDGKIYRDRFGPTDGEYDASNLGFNTIDDNHVGSYSVWSLSSSYDFDVNDIQMTLFGNIDNLFDRDPPLGLAGLGGGTNPTYYDTLGRRFRIGVRANF